MTKAPKDYSAIAIKSTAFSRLRQCRDLMQKELMVSQLSMGSVIERLANIYIKENREKLMDFTKKGN